MFLLKYAEIILYDKPTEIYMEKWKYKKTVSNCNKWRSLIKTVVGRNINFLSRKLDHIRTEYGEIINASEISISIDKIYDDWNEYDIETVSEENKLNISAVCLLMMI